MSTVHHVDLSQLRAAAAGAGASGEQIRRAIATAMYRISNPLRDKMKVAWKAEGFMRSGKLSHRTKIVAAVRVVVRRRGEHWYTIVGVRAKGANRKARVVNVLESGRRRGGHPTRGHHIRLRAMRGHMMQATATLQREVARAAQDIIAGRIKPRQRRAR